MLYLASRSPRRRHLLGQLDIEFEVLEIDIDETWDGHESPDDYVLRLALEKGRAGKKRVRTGDAVLAADTEVVLDGNILGKPADGNDAFEMLRSLSGRTHQVITAVALINEAEYYALSPSRVSFKTLTREECRRYCNSGEPLDKAGAYAIQGRAAAFITRLEGSYSGVMGLPLTETRLLLQPGP